MEHRDDKEQPEGDKKGKEIVGGIHIRKQDLWMVAGGALGALALLGLGRATQKIRPAAVGAVKEGYAFKEWVTGKAERFKEDIEDIVAEGAHQYQEELTASADAVKREKEILEKIEKVVEKKLAKKKPAAREEQA